MKKCLVVLLALVLASSGFGVEWGGASAAVTESKRKINLAGRQRMLTQRMAKALCFAAIGIQKEQHLAMARDAHHLFDQTLTELRDGGGEFNFQREERQIILSELRDVEHLWATYRDKITRAWNSGEVDPETLGLIYETNVPTLFQANEAVSTWPSRRTQRGDRPAVNSDRGSVGPFVGDTCPRCRRRRPDGFGNRIHCDKEQRGARRNEPCCRHVRSAVRISGNVSKTPSSSRNWAAEPVSVFSGWRENHSCFR